MGEKMQKKHIIALILCILFSISVLLFMLRKDSKTGCIPLFQKAEFALEYARKNPDGSVIYPWESGYKCVFSPRKVIKLIGVVLIALVISNRVLRKHKLKNNRELSKN